MYLIDTNVISELRKKSRMNTGVKRFFEKADEQDTSLFISVITVGELRRGIESLRYKGDLQQASNIEAWFQTILQDYAGCILEFAEVESQVWGRLLVPHPENPVDKQIAATALVNGLTLVTRNVKDFKKTGITLMNPFV